MFSLTDKQIDLQRLQSDCLKLWSESGVYDYKPDSTKPLYSVDTPPPYVSAAHLHIGHAMSYTQAEMIVRYKRMKGHNIFYPMGFDDNGLPTERYVERLHKINKKKISRSEFRALCIEETEKGAKAYETLWNALGLSVDWKLRYSTIDERSRKTAQKSFINLFQKQLVYRANEPVLWDTHFETSLAQADLDVIDRKGKLYDIAFNSVADTSGEETVSALIISTTRPELIPACVALFFNPEDERYQHLKEHKAIVPLFGQEIPILCCESVDRSFGSGLMMVCTFGDSEDIKKWKEFKLDTRLCITTEGKMNENAGEYAGLLIAEARNRIATDLDALGLISAKKTVKQKVSVCERSEVPVEFVMEPQWFINLLDHVDEFRRRANEINWSPAWMKVRLDDWIDGLKYNWNISRQRFYGVPFPLWYVKETGEIIIPEESDLPVDPLEDEPPAWAKAKYRGLTIVPETDVMETWMTSSVSPLINANWASASGGSKSMDIYPMSLRVQGFEIIRTWLFYTLVKSEFHTDSIPWENVMISGWGLNEQGKKISKRDLEKQTDTKVFNRYDPFSLVEKYGADAIRYWSASASLGKNLKYKESEIRDGRKIVIKLWNVARMCFMRLQGFNASEDYIAYNNRPIEDQWIASELNLVIEDMGHSFESFEFSVARDTLHKFFWMRYCDSYLELIKPRFKTGSLWSEHERKAAQSTLLDTLRTLLGLFAPIIPFITEEIYQQANCFGEDHHSIHASSWPDFDDSLLFEKQGEMNLILEVMQKARKLRSDKAIGQGTEIGIKIGSHNKSLIDNLRLLDKHIQTASRSIRIKYTVMEAGQCDDSFNLSLL